LVGALFPRLKFQNCDARLHGVANSSQHIKKIFLRRFCWTGFAVAAVPETLRAGATLIFRTWIFPV